MNAKFLAVIMALASLLLLAAASPRFKAEYATLLFSRLTPDQQLYALAKGGVQLPSSLRAERLVLRTCETALASPLGQFQPEDARNALRAACAALSIEARDRSPTSSWAHLLVAATATSDAEFAYAFVVSQATGAYEGDLAQRRFALGIGRLARGGAAFRSALAADIAVLAQFAAGRAQLVQDYRAFPERREFIVSSLEAAPDAAQAAFVASLGRAGAGR